jgi:hypothetical protein
MDQPTQPAHCRHGDECPGGGTQQCYSEASVAGVNRLFDLRQPAAPTGEDHAVHGEDDGQCPPRVTQVRARPLLWHNVTPFPTT